MFTVRETSFTQLGLQVTVNSAYPENKIFEIDKRLQVAGDKLLRQINQPVDSFKLVDVRSAALVTQFSFERIL